MTPLEIAAMGLIAFALGMVLGAVLTAYQFPHG